MNSRRKFLKTGLIGSAIAYAGLAKGGLQSTPPEIEGPFYPVLPQKDKDFDLTSIDGQLGAATGKPIWIVGKVIDVNGSAIEDATVDLWQANAAGRYRHPHDSNQAPLDPNFQGWAIVASGIDGGFRFKTIMPGSYPASRNWNRPPHIHFKVTKKGYVELVTQMYFEGNALNEEDLLIQRKSLDEQKLMIAEKIKDSPETYSYKIVLQKA